MIYRRLGKTDLKVSEIGLGAEWLERHNYEECKAIIDTCAEQGINILDCWMSEPNVRTHIGKAISGNREKWYIQGHIGSVWIDGQYKRTREMDKVVPAFEDLLQRLGTDYIDLGMIHFVDSMKDYEEIVNGPFIEYVRKLKADGVIKHIGMSSHNPEVAIRAVKEGLIENLLFSINPAFDILPASEDINTLFVEEYDASLAGMDPIRAELYKLCEQNDVGITVMKGYAGGRLFDEKRSPLGVALTPVQCIHYVLTRPAVAAIMAGFDNPGHVLDAVKYETASDDEKDYATVLANAPKHAYAGQCTYCGHCK
ncbi:MAG: aldo/keto reductase, partial [Oscillospiraceae bacterium]|nr:aldo/keto reductase [Oscillospiraceae bacterium]